MARRINCVFTTDVKANMILKPRATTWSLWRMFLHLSTQLPRYCKLGNLIYEPSLTINYMLEIKFLKVAWKMSGTWTKCRSVCRVLVFTKSRIWQWVMRDAWWRFAGRWLVTEVSLSNWGSPRHLHSSWCLNEDNPKDLVRLKICDVSRRAIKDAREHGRVCVYVCVCVGCVYGMCVGCVYVWVVCMCVCVCCVCVYGVCVGCVYVCVYGVCVCVCV